jgi:hypothetical protein
MSPESMIAVVPFFVPLVVVFGALFFGIARSQTQSVRRIELLEQKVELLRNGAKAPRLVAGISRSPLAAAAGQPKESGQP